MTHKRGHKTRGRKTRGRKTRRGGEVRDWTTGEDVSPKGNESDMPLDKVFPEKKEGAFSMVNPMVIKATDDAIQTAVAQGADAEAAKIVARGNLDKLTKDKSVPGKRGLHTLTVNGKDDTLTGRGRRKTARKLPKGAKGFMVRRVCAISIVPVGVKTRRRRKQ
jgi:hypothetical protein